MVPTSQAKSLNFLEVWPEFSSSSRMATPNDLFKSTSIYRLKQIIDNFEIIQLQCVMGDLTLTALKGGGAHFAPYRFSDCCILTGRALKLILCDFSYIEYVTSKIFLISRIICPHWLVCR